MSLRGYRPIAEIMFGDFLALCADQLINHLAKFHWMYNGQVETPVVVRAPVGGRRGYGPTHSQCIEKIFFGVPGLVLVAVSVRHDPGELRDPAGGWAVAILRASASSVDRATSERPPVSALA